MCGALGQAVERLADDLHRLLHLGQADRVAVVVVALGADRDAELEVLVARVRRRLAQVPRVARGAQQRPGDAEVEQRLLVERAHAAQAAQHDLVAVEQVAVLVDAVGHVVEELAALRLPARRDVLEDAADLDVARVHALAGGHLEQVEDLLALAEAVPEHRDRAEVERARPEPDEVAHDPVELEVDDAQVLRALGDLDVEQRLDGAAERHRVEVVGQVVHPLDDGDDLPVALVLGRLLDAGVDVADDRLEVAHDLALERDEQPQHAVRGRVVRAPC